MNGIISTLALVKLDVLNCDVNSRL